MVADLDYTRFLSESALRRQPNAIREADASAMTEALQYSPTPGQADLLGWLKKLQIRYHSPIDFNRYDLCITNGSSEGVAKVFELILNPGDAILIDSPCYPGSLDFLLAYGADIISIETDSNGMSAEHLNETLSNWPNSKGLPKTLYTISTGSNPTGASMSLERKINIYDIARKYNLLIIEDDPYYFLQFTKPEPSFLSIDTDGRVIRLDSMSKVLSPGIMKFYENRKMLMIDAINKYLKDMVAFHEPKAGMFIWLKIYGVEDTRKLIYEKALGKEVLLLPGSVFFVDKSKNYPYVRVSYSLCALEQIEIGMERFSKVLQEELIRL
ncbi:unnamed protein product [Rotaria sp. Silwood1]|nr:unnamed protein product [Rotaria sp. Silwood1]